MPSSEPDLCYLTAGEALKLFGKRDLSPVELMQAILRRIELVNPKVNALGDCFFDEAIAGARRAEARWIDGTARPLEGIPLAVKDAQHVAGQRTTYGSPLYRENFAQVSDPMIARLEAAGAIIHARTTVSEFCISGVCFSSMWGRTCNPWNLTYSPGGSSGGSGAALAAGMTTLATGTDMGGSIRIPASACGVVGFKPLTGATPMARFSMLTASAPAVRSHAAPWTSVSSRTSSPVRIQETTTVCVKNPAIPSLSKKSRACESPGRSILAIAPSTRTCR